MVDPPCLNMPAMTPMCILAVGFVYLIWSFVPYKPWAVWLSSELARKRYIST